jgi:hypothetical protein
MILRDGSSAADAVNMLGLGYKDRRALLRSLTSLICAMKKSGGKNSEASLVVRPSELGRSVVMSISGIPMGFPDLELVILPLQLVGVRDNYFDRKLDKRSFCLLGLTGLGSKLSTKLCFYVLDPSYQLQTSHHLAFFYCHPMVFCEVRGPERLATLIRRMCRRLSRY